MLCLFIYGQVRRELIHVSPTIDLLAYLIAVQPACCCRKRY